MDRVIINKDKKEIHLPDTVDLIYCCDISCLYPDYQIYFYAANETTNITGELPMASGDGEDLADNPLH